MLFTKEVYVATSGLKRIDPLVVSKATCCLEMFSQSPIKLAKCYDLT